MSNHLIYESLINLIFYVLIFNWLINFFFFMNKINSNHYIKELNQTFDLREVAFPGVLYTKLIESEEKCDEEKGFFERNPLIWPGTKNGSYVGPFQANRKCSSLECGYECQKIFGFKVNRYTNVEKQICCNYYVWRPHSYSWCWPSDYSCSCDDTYEEYFNNTYTDDPSLYRDEFYMIPALDPFYLNRFKGKKICEKIVKNYTLFDSECNDGVYCYNYICIKNADKCPDYSEFGITATKAISSISFTLNHKPCMFYDRPKNKLYPLERKHPLSLVNSDSMPGFSEGCNDKDQQYFDQFSFSSSVSQKEFYDLFGLYKKLENLDGMIKNVEKRYVNFLNDTAYISGISHPVINKIEKCTNSLKNLNEISQLTFKILKGGVSTVVYVFDIIMITVLSLTALGFYFVKKNKPTPHDVIKIFYFILLTLLINFFYNLIIYLMYAEEITNLDNFNNIEGCFDSYEPFNKYLGNLKKGVENHQELFYITNKKILIQNSISVGLCLITLLFLGKISSNSDDSLNDRGINA